MKTYSILILEDEPLILMDLEFAAEDRGCEPHLASGVKSALDTIESQQLDVAILDVSLGGGTTCFPVAQELRSREIPFILHTGDLDRHNEKVRVLDAPLIAKPAAAEKVIAAAIVCAEGEDADAVKIAAE